MMNRLTFNNYHSMNLVHRTQQGSELWLGDYYAATNLSLLKQKNIRAVLTSAAMLGVSYPKEQEMSHKVINAFDVPSYKMTPHFEQAFRFIDQSLKKGNLLVHCAAGISRSTTFVLVFLMRAEAMSFQQALTYVRNKRSIICPNYGFQNELKRYEVVLKKTSTSKPHPEKQKQAPFDNFAEKKAVFDFLSEDKKRPLKGQEKFNATLDANQSQLGGNQSYLGEKTLGRKTTDNNTFLRGKSVNYQQKERVNAGSVDYRSKISNLAKGFSSFKMENPKIITIKK